MTRRRWLALILLLLLLGYLLTGLTQVRPGEQVAQVAQGEDHLGHVRHV